MSHNPFGTRRNRGIARSQVSFHNSNLMNIKHLLDPDRLGAKVLLQKRMVNQRNSDLRNAADSPYARSYQHEQTGGGIAFDELPIGAAVEVVTGHTTYRVENRGDGKALISGHPTYCPEPVLVDLHGSVGGPNMFKIWSIAPDLKLEFNHPQFGVIRTSRVRSVRELKSEVPS